MRRRLIIHLILMIRRRRVRRIRLIIMWVYIISCRRRLRIWRIVLSMSRRRLFVVYE